LCRRRWSFVYSVLRSHFSSYAVISFINFHERLRSPFRCMKKIQNLIVASQDNTQWRVRTPPNPFPFLLPTRFSPFVEGGEGGSVSGESPHMPPGGWENIPLGGGSTHPGILMVGSGPPIKSERRADGGRSVSTHLIRSRSSPQFHRHRPREEEEKR
jgi:hypothetical protein